MECSYNALAFVCVFGLRQGTAREYLVKLSVIIKYVLVTARGFLETEKVNAEQLKWSGITSPDGDQSSRWFNVCLTFDVATTNLNI